jgi:hypothetical protein
MAHRPHHAAIEGKRMTNSKQDRIGFTALAAVTVAVALAGCGGGSSTSDAADAKKTADANATKATNEAVNQVMTDLQAASLAGDGKRICREIFTPKLADSVTESASSGSCAKEVKRKLFSPETKLTVQTIAVSDAANATATVDEANGNTSTVFLVKQSGRWRIRSVQPA